MPRKTLIILSVAVVAIAIFSPYQIINSDSVTGFEALKGWQTTGKFNTIAEPGTENISVFNCSFLTWWTPGQYMVPYLFTLLGLSIGHAITLINLIATLLGLYGFFKLFRYYGFRDSIIAVSLLLIASSNTVLYRFIAYQGGETLSFVLFPWAVYWFVKARKTIIKASIAAGCIVIGFMAKSQMLIALAPLYLIIPIAGYIRAFIKKEPPKIPVMIKELTVILAGVIVGMAICYLFILQGPAPAQLVGLNISPMDYLVPAAAPVATISSLSDIVIRLKEVYPGTEIILLSLLAVLTVTVLTVQIRQRYTILAAMYYLFFSVVFILLYIFDSPIDYHVRHFKFVGYLFFPLLVSFCRNYTTARVVQIGTAAIVLFSLFNHYRLTKIWFNNTYVTTGDFRVNNKEFPRELYTYMSGVKDRVLFFSPFEPRWAIGRDIICVSNKDRQVYKGHGLPVIYVGDPAVLFPGYRVTTVDSVAGHKVVHLK